MIFFTIVTADSSVSGCRLVLAEGDAGLDKAQLLQHYALQMPVSSGQEM